MSILSSTDSGKDSLVKSYPFKWTDTSSYYEPYEWTINTSAFKPLSK